MATLTRCDICTAEYDPATTPTASTVTNPSEIIVYGTRDEWDVCSPACLSSLAARRDPTLADTPSRTTDLDRFYEDLRWVNSNLLFLDDPDVTDETRQRLLTSTRSRIAGMMSRFLPADPDDDTWERWLEERARFDDTREDRVE